MGVGLQSILSVIKMFISKCLYWYVALKSAISNLCNICIIVEEIRNNGSNKVLKYFCHKTEDEAGLIARRKKSSQNNSQAFSSNFPT